MWDAIEEPFALARLRWFSPQEGGRRSGPPSARVYAAAARFCAQSPGGSLVLSILLERERTGAQPQEGSGAYADLYRRIGFLAPELAAPLVRAGVRCTVTEGPRPVAEGVVLERC